MKFEVLLHEGVVNPSLHPILSQGLREIYLNRFGGRKEQVAVNITEIPRGRFFTAAKPSHSSLIGGTVPAGTSKSERTQLMSEITAMWCRITGYKANDVVVSMSD